jgi:hypothetical protein
VVALSTLPHLLQVLTVGIPDAMTENEELRNQAADQTASGTEAEAQQAVVDRVLSWHEGAPVETVREELRKAADEVGVSVDDAWLDERARQISEADPAQREG